MSDIVDSYLRERAYATHAAHAAQAQRAARAAAAARVVAEGEGALIASGLTASPEQQMLLRHVAALATADPPITMTWLVEGTMAAALSEGSYLRAQRGVATPALISPIEYGVALHELGHGRAWVAPKIAGEVSAWAWAVQHALIWTRPMHDELCRCLRTYLAGATGRDVLDVANAEAWMSDRTFRHYEKPIAPALRAYERRQFALTHGVASCPCGDPADCLAPDGTTPVCGTCRQRAINRRRS